MPIQELDKIRILMKLKEVERALPVKDRKETSAEHSWGCMILADYFIAKLKLECLTSHAHRRTLTGKTIPCFFRPILYQCPLHCFQKRNVP